jgi:hypothetical protein
VLRTLQRAGFIANLGRQWVYVCVQDAVTACAKLQSMEGGGSVEHVEPVRKYSRTPAASVASDSPKAAKTVE